ncbi:MAG: YegS/Rv2252/BmrU family lipid kinase [Desulfotomaculaceae bacterium]|nr:YegS/Rv2252/BmrU family lipid kinase [Desulfotomaculaceae bacterium]
MVYPCTDIKKSLKNMIDEERSAILIVNTRSRRGQKFFSAALEELTRQGVSITASYPVRYPERLPEVVQEAVKHKPNLIIVGGGDGTISSVVNFIADHDVVLGILPLGTINSFARTLDIPLNLRKAISVIAKGRVVSVDLGKVDDNYFSNIVALGVAAKVARNITRRLKIYTGAMAYGLMGMIILFSHRPFDCTLTMNNEVFKFNTHQVVIANGRYFGITPIVSKAMADEREIIVFVMDTSSRWQTLKLWIAFLLQKASASSQFRLFRAREVIVEAAPPQYVEVDGEIITKTPVHVSLAPGAMKVLVPDDGY